MAYSMTDDLSIINKSGNQAFIALGYLICYHVFTISMQTALKTWMSLALVVSRSRQARAVYQRLLTRNPVNKSVSFTVHYLIIAMMWVMLVVDPICFMCCSLFNCLTPLLDQCESMPFWLLRPVLLFRRYHDDVKSQSSPQGARRARLKVRLVSTRRRDGVQVRRSHS